jgi:hypothetical protein
MVQKMFSVEAVWDKDAGVFIARSDIRGLHIEAPTLAEFEAVLQETAPELIVQNHILPDRTAAGMAWKDLIPTMRFVRPEQDPTTKASAA